MKRFLDFNPILRWLVALLFAATLIWVLVVWIRLVDASIIWALGILIIVPIIQFFITPLFTLIGWYTYHSPMVVSFGSTSRVIDLHNGTSFDYLLEMRGVPKGVKWKRRMLTHYLDALLSIIERVEQGQLPPSVAVRGSSYFLSKRSAERLGFTVASTSFLEKLNISLNYIDLTWTYSLSNGRLAFPNLNNISTVRITGEKLVEQKGRIAGYLRRIENE